MRASETESPRAQGQGAAQGEDAACPAALEAHFEPFRRDTVGIDRTFETPYGPKRIVYADWTASGRLYGPLERAMLERFGPYVGNTHSETSLTGTAMTRAYAEARRIVKAHVGARRDDVLVMAGTGMTGAVCKLQRLLGLRTNARPGRERLRERPVVFVTHMEHHSNHTSWLETAADVVVLEPAPDGRIDPDALRARLPRFADRPHKIGAFTACSNVTGIETPYRELARIMHEHGGVCFVDFAASAPYVPIDMHPGDPAERLDAVTFSPHKFLGGPGTSGVLVFGRHLYEGGDERAPDHPGGGTVTWTDPWEGRTYIRDIEMREDGGTPGFLQTIRAALCLRLKERMDPAKMLERERQLLAETFASLRRVPGLRILADEHEERLGIVSFHTGEIHYNLIVRLLNDRFGIQVRGGCSCAGTYGHHLLEIDRGRSQRILRSIGGGDLSPKPGWVRLSLHPTTTDRELRFVLDAIAETVARAREWSADYRYDPESNEFVHASGWDPAAAVVAAGFDAL